MKLPDFKTKGERIAFLIENKAILIADKKAQFKKADGFGYVEEKEVNKANNPVSDPPDELRVTAIINTTNVMDSHDDVHIKGLWTKSLKENRNIMHLQEHKMAFDSIISKGKDLKAKAVNYDWSDLGFKFDGQTQALVFESTVKREQNKFMHDQYAKGNVDNHSVGMRYVKIDLAVDDQDYEAENKVWNKYIDQIVNKEDAELQGYFWAVTEAKVIEGSAVPIGSNTLTPTLENNKEPLQDTPKEPSHDTQKNISVINNFKFI